MMQGAASTMRDSQVSTSLSFLTAPLTGRALAGRVAIAGPRRRAGAAEIPGGHRLFSARATSASGLSLATRCSAHLRAVRRAQNQTQSRRLGFRPRPRARQLRGPRFAANRSHHDVSRGQGSRAAQTRFQSEQRADRACPDGASRSGGRREEARGAQGGQARVTRRRPVQVGARARARFASDAQGRRKGRGRRDAG